MLHFIETTNHTIIWKLDMQSYEFRFIFELEMKCKEKYTNDKSRRGRGIKEKKSKTIGSRKNDVVNKGR